MLIVLYTMLRWACNDNKEIEKPAHLWGWAYTNINDTDQHEPLFFAVVIRFNKVSDSWSVQCFKFTNYYLQF